MNELANLEQKFNHLNKKIWDLEEEKNRKKKQFEELKMEQKDKDMVEEVRETKHENLEESDRIKAFLHDFYKVMEKAIEEKAFIENKYATQYSNLYYKVEKEVLEELILRNTQMELKDFLYYCSRFLFIKSEENGKNVYTSGRIRIYFVNKAFVEELEALEASAQ